MLTDPIEIQIIQSARQKNVRDPQRSRRHFEHILADFFAPVDFHGQRILDLGPGQHDFAELLRPRGATVVGIDNDPAVLELGRYKGLEVIEGNLKYLAELDLAGRFDGIFCKLSLNAYWFHDDDTAQRAYINTLCDCLAPNGWAWIAPWNGVPAKLPLSEAVIAGIAALQRETFTARGFTAFEFSIDQTKTYGVHGVTYNHPLFLRRIVPAARVGLCEAGA